MRLSLLSEFIVEKLINPIKRINPLLTVNNPAPIPGCHAPEGCCTQCCGPLDLARLLTESPCVMTTEVLDIRKLVLSPVKVG